MTARAGSTRRERVERLLRGLASPDLRDLTLAADGFVFGRGVPPVVHGRRGAPSLES